MQARGGASKLAYILIPLEGLILTKQPGSSTEIRIRGPEIKVHTALGGGLPDNTAPHLHPILREKCTGQNYDHRKIHLGGISSASMEDLQN